jgi:peptide/nickel transport system substrate-binding protein
VLSTDPFAAGAISMKRFLLALVCFQMLLTVAVGGSDRELRFCIHAEPKTFNPALVADESSETIRYLTGGVLIRINRLTQNLEPELAETWRVMDFGREIIFKIREGILFSDGTPFAADDVAFTIRTLMDPQLNSPAGDSFRSGAGSVEAKVIGTHGISIRFSVPVAGLERLFDQVAILSSRSPRKEMAVLGPFVVAEHRPGSQVLLRRNPYYWKRDSEGKRLPYLSTIRLEIQQNRDTEMLRFLRGQLDLINNMDTVLFDRLGAESPGAMRDAGPSLESEQLWFNQVTASPIPDYKKAWFRSRNFRRALAEAINRDDLCRLAYLRHAVPAVGPVSIANQFWFNQQLAAQAFDPAGALRRLQQDGFHVQRGMLVDSQGHPVAFSLITNAGNKERERVATLVQQDLKKIGIQLNIVTLDFPSLIDRISRSFNYEACLLGLVNVDLDPNGQMNVWLSSASNHQWNPNQKSPETSWEAEIDRLMHKQAASLDPKERKAAFDRVQQIVCEEAPFIYLVNKRALVAVSPMLRNVKPVALPPHTYWNVEYWQFRNDTQASRPAAPKLEDPRRS